MVLLCVCAFTHVVTHPVDSSLIGHQLPNYGQGLWHSEVITAIEMGWRTLPSPLPLVCSYVRLQFLCWVFLFFSTLHILFIRPI